MRSIKDNRWRNSSLFICNFVWIRESPNSWIVGRRVAWNSTVPRKLNRGTEGFQSCATAGFTPLRCAWGLRRKPKPVNARDWFIAHPARSSGFTSRGTPPPPPKCGREAMALPTPRSRPRGNASRTHQLKPLRQFIGPRRNRPTIAASRRPASRGATVALHLDSAMLRLGMGSLTGDPRLSACAVAAAISERSSPEPARMRPGPCASSIGTTGPASRLSPVP